MIDARLFRSHSGDGRDWLQAKHRLSPTDAGSLAAAPSPISNDEEIAPWIGFSRHSHVDFGNHSLPVRQGAVAHEDSAMPLTSHWKKE